MAHMEPRSTRCARQQRNATSARLPNSPQPATAQPHLAVWQLKGLLQGGGVEAGLQLLLVVQRHIAQLLLDVAHDFALCARRSTKQRALGSTRCGSGRAARQPPPRSLFPAVQQEFRVAARLAAAHGAHNSSQMPLHGPSPAVVVKE